MYLGISMSIEDLQTILIVGPSALSIVCLFMFVRICVVCSISPRQHFLKMQNIKMHLLDYLKFLDVKIIPPDIIFQFKC